MDSGECINPEESILEKVKKAMPRALDRETAAEWKTAVEHNKIEESEQKRLLSVIDDMMCDLKLTEDESKKFLSELRSAVEGKSRIDKVKSGEIKIEPEIIPEETGKHNKDQKIKQIGAQQESFYASKKADERNDPERNNVEKMVVKKKVEAHQVAPKMKEVIRVIESEKTEKFIKDIINKHLVGYKFKRKTQGIDFELVTLSKEKIDSYVDNFQLLLKTLIDMESDGEIKAINPNSSARGLGQILIGNRRHAQEVADLDSNGNRKWVNPDKLNEKQNKLRLDRIKGKDFDKTRRVYHPSSLETYINNMLDDGIYLDFLPKNKITKPSKIDPMQWNMEQQIQFITATLVSEGKQIINGVQEWVWMKDHLGLVLEDQNTWAIKKIYEKFWHTDPSKGTMQDLDKTLKHYAAN